MDIDGFMPLKNDMLEYMDKKAKDGGFNEMLLLLTDILTEGSQLLVTGDETEIVEKTFNVEIKDNTAFLPGVLSRKKQVIPPLTNTINNL